MESDFPYDGLPVFEASVDSDREQAIIRLRMGRVPALAVEERRFHVLSDGAIYYAVDDFFRCLISGGATVTVEVVNSARARDVPGFLLGCIFGALCHQRDELVVHAGCLEIDGRAVVLTGPSGVGKSTFAAALMQRGFRILSDDVIILRVAPAPTAVPTVARCKLWQDSVTALTLAPARKLPQRHKQTESGSWAKYECLAGDLFCAEARKIDRIIHLLPAGHEQSGRTLTAAEAVDMLWNNIYHRDVAVAMGRTPDLFRRCVALATPVPHIFWSGTLDLDRLSDNVDDLLAMIKDGSP